MDYWGIDGNPKDAVLDTKWKADWRNTLPKSFKHKPKKMERKKSVKCLTSFEEKEEDFATLILPDGETYHLPIFSGTTGPRVIDVSALYAHTGLFTYDPGFTSTASCESAITYIDGPQGTLLHRGYKIEDLAQYSDFEELSYMLLYGELPNERQKITHISRIRAEQLVHEKLRHFYGGFKSDAHPMSIMVGVVGALSSFYHDSLDIRKAAHRQRASYRLLAKIPVIAAYAYKYSIGEPFVYPRDDLSYAENFLYMLFAIPTRDYQLDPVKVRCMETFLMLHADHEQNASTSTVRIAGSSYANPFACISSGIAALWGPAHGGANEAVIKMLQEIGTRDKIPEYLLRAKDKKDPFRLMGFGHRVYKNYDPRAKIMKAMCHKLLDAMDIRDEPFLDLAMELERIALEDEYFQQRKLFPNVDFYSGIVLRALGIPLSMFTVLFAVSRTVGWISQWKEMIEDPRQRIGRPRQLYKGKTQRAYVPMAARIDDPEAVPTVLPRLKTPHSLEHHKTVSVHVAAT